MSEKVCACSGIRRCGLCDANFSFSNTNNPNYIYCSVCENAVKSETYPLECPHSSDSIAVPGVTLVHDFITKEEELELVDAMDTTSVWQPSQSGRRKQDYGVKVNFKKKSFNITPFTGLPLFIRPLVKKLQSFLPDFEPVELCNLEYEPIRKSHIDPHLDDVWLWNERLVNVNLLSPTIITLTHPSADISVPVNARTLLILSDAARFSWPHSIKPEHVVSRRISIVMRELNPEIKKDYPEISSIISKFASSFNGISVQCYRDVTQKPISPCESIPFVSTAEQLKNIEISTILDEYYGLSGMKIIKIIPGWWEVNVHCENSEHKNVIVKIAHVNAFVDPLAFNERLKFQNWVSCNTSLNVPFVLSTLIGYLIHYLNEGKTLLYVMEFVCDKVHRIGETPQRVLGDFLVQFTKEATLVYDGGDRDPVIRWHIDTIENDIDEVLNAVRLRIKDEYFRKISICSFIAMLNSCKMYGAGARAGWCHADIHETNLLLPKYGEIKDFESFSLIDFGDVTYGYVILDLAFLIVRVMTFHQLNLNPPVDLLNAFCSKFELNLSEKKMLYPYVLGLCVLSLSDGIESLERDLEKKEIREAYVQRMYRGLEYMFFDSTFKMKFEEILKISL